MCGYYFGSLIVLYMKSIKNSNNKKETIKKYKSLTKVIVVLICLCSPNINIYHSINVSCFLNRVDQYSTGTNTLSFLCIKTVT